jgi:hypothetical protein
MRKYFSIDQLANASARLAQSEAAMMQRDLKKLRDSVAGLNRTLHAPIIRARQQRTKTTRNGFNTLGFLGIGAALLGDTGLLDGFSGKIGGTVKIGGMSFSQSYGETQDSNASSAQIASANLAAIMDSQRIR